LPHEKSDRNGFGASAKNPTGAIAEDAAVQRSSRHDLARALSPRYKHASRPDKTRLLDEFCRLTGYSRKYALVLLRQPPPPPPRSPIKRRRRRPRSYGEAEVALLRLCWTVSDGICAKRLAPFLPELLGRLRTYQALRGFAPETIARVAGMSASTIDRALRGWRPRGVHAGFSTTRPGSVLKQQVAIKTFAEWDGAQPGYFEMDLVAHCGWTVAGQFLYTLCIVDVATGWVACAGLRDKRKETVLHALQRLEQRLPMPIRGLDSDNGSEFLSRELVAYCASQGITFTRSRPYTKNDNCHVEQKNWAVVRRLVGYDRLELAALPALERLHDWRMTTSISCTRCGSWCARVGMGRAFVAGTTRPRRPTSGCCRAAA
jgi:hypothetical protein